jgi:acyl-CoA thioesterase
MTQDHPHSPLKEFLEKQLRGLIPFWVTLGMEVLEARPGQARVRVRFDARLVNANGVVHGGAVFAAADAAVAVALLGLLDAGMRTATLEMKINFLKPVDGADIIAEAAIIHKGGKTAVGEVTVRDGSGAIVAKALGTYAIAGKKSELESENKSNE